MEAAFGDPDPDSEYLDLSSIEDEDVEALPIFSHFSQLMPPHWNREPLSQWCKTTSTCKSEAIICAHALKRLSPLANNSQYTCGMEVMRMFWRLSLMTKWPEVLTSVKNKMDLFLLQAPLQRIIPLATDLRKKQCINLWVVVSWVCHSLRHLGIDLGACQ